MPPDKIAANLKEIIEAVIEGNFVNMSIQSLILILTNSLHKVPDTFMKGLS